MLENNDKITSNPQVVLFTGGRDSSLTASILMMRQIPVCLLSSFSGSSVHGHLTKLRAKELKKKFGDLVVDHHVMDTTGTFRSIALADIENDILTDKKNLIVLGEKIAILTHTINFCLRNNYSTVNVGYTKYQEEFPEQRQTSIDLFKEFLSKYQIKLECPIYEDAISIEYVKYRLMEVGLSNKPLEGSTIFGDTFSKADNQTILNYIKRKEAKAHEHVKFLTQGIF